jgi:hypothetical protein
VPSHRGVADGGTGVRYAGHLINHPDRLEGTRGIGYDYVLAGNGVFVESEGPLMAARVLVEPLDVQGLAPLEPKLVLRHGKIHGSVWELALNLLISSSRLERYVAIVRQDDVYRIKVPDQEQSAGGIKEYDRQPNTVVDIHSHPGSGEPHFSMTDDGDEIGFQVYGVVSNVGAGKPFVRLRVGIYGYWQEIPWSDVFKGALVDVHDCWELPLTAEHALVEAVRGSSFQHTVDGAVVMEHGPEGPR